MQPRITITGDIGSGKSTVAKLLSQKLGYEYICAGSYFRDLAKKSDVSVLQINELAKEDPEIDRNLDNYIAEYSSKYNVVIDARIGFHFVPNSIKIYLQVKPEEAAKRVIAANREEESYSCFSDAVIQINKRMESERFRYWSMYNINILDVSNYDLVLDTTEYTTDEVLDFISRKIENL